MLDLTLFSLQSALYVGTHGVRDVSSGLFTLIAGSLGAVCGLHALCCKGSTRGNITFYSTLCW